MVNQLQGSSLYRKWRPRRFDEMVGQEHIVTTLRNAIGRDQIGHAYIFAGPRGTGKTSVARILAQAVNCHELTGEVTKDVTQVEPCGECDACMSILAGNSMTIIEMDAASNRGIDDIRELQERVPYASIHGRYRVYILDEAHMLTAEAFNALLKTLEEPPAHVIFILATTEPHKIPITIQSRCQRFDFRFLTVREIVERLRQVADEASLEVEDAALYSMAMAAEGSVRDALGLLEQCRDYSSGPIEESDVRQVMGTVARDVLFQYAELMQQGDVGKLLQLVEEVSLGGADIGHFIREILGLYRDLLLYRASGGSYEPLLPAEFSKRLQQIADGFNLEQLLSAVDQLSDVEFRIRYAAQPRFLLEMATIRLGGIAYNDSEVAVTEKALKPDVVVGKTKEPADRGKKKTLIEKSKEEMSRRTPEATKSRINKEQLEGSDRVTAFWERFKSEVKKESMPAHALLQPARPGPITEDRFLIVFEDEFSFHRERTENENRAVLERVLERLLGKRLRIQCVFESDFSKDDEFNAGKERASESMPSDEREENPSDEGEKRVTEASQSSNEEPKTDYSSVEDIVQAFDGTVLGKWSEMKRSESGPNQRS